MIKPTQYFRIVLAGLILVIRFEPALAQTALTRDSFFVTQNHFPENYKTIIAGNRWELLGTFKNTRKKIMVPDSLTITTIPLFDEGGHYRKIKGITGVIESGLFIGYNVEILVA